MATNTATESIEFEDVQQDPNPRVDEPQVAKILTAEDVAKNEIQKFNIADAAIAQMKQEFSGLTIAGIDDREGYKKVKAAWQVVRNKRLLVEKKHKEIKADYLVVSRAIDGEKNRLVGLLEPLEGELKTEIDRIDDLIEAEKQKAEREAQERLQQRVAKLLESGIQFNGSFYAIGETITVDVVTLKNLNDVQFSALLDRVEAENAKILEAKEEQARKEREEREAIQRQKEANEKLEAELRNQREEMERQQAEMRQQRVNLRIQILQNAGFIWDDGPHALIFKQPDAGNIRISVYDFQELNGDQWDAKFLEIRADINRLRTLQAEKDEEKREQERLRVETERLRKEKADRWHARAAQLFKLGMHEGNGKFYILTDTMDETVYRYAADMFDTPEVEWDGILKGIGDEILETRTKDEQNKKEAAAKKEAERLAALSDIERIDIYLNELAALKQPTINDERLKAAWNLFEDSRANAVTTLVKTLHLISKK